MEKTVWKFTLPLGDVVTVWMPGGAEILCVQFQQKDPVIWALVDPSVPVIERHFRMTGTGHPVPDDGPKKYIGTFQMIGGTLVFHVFELLPQNAEAVPLARLPTM